MIDVYASQPGYWRHLAPITRELRARGHEVRTGASKLGRPWGDRLMRAPETDLLVVASWVDARRWPWLRTAYVEHGSGQTYQGQRDGYAGSEKLDHVVLFIAPNETVVGRWNERYPSARAVAVGCAALDQHVDPKRISVIGHTYDSGAEDAPASDRHAREGLRPGGVPLVAFTAHWFCAVVPETMPALWLYERALVALRDAGSVRMLGHAHPRAQARTEALWKRLGIEYDSDPDSVLRRADLLVMDNTSLGYEAAALDIPVVALNAPWDEKRRTGYRRDVEHGLRFWSHVPGIECDEPEHLDWTIGAALADGPEARILRERAAAAAYAHPVDGLAAARAADAIEGML